MSHAVTQTVQLGTQWPTLDPFLFCAHHLDRYPQGDGQLGPAASLTGRDLGQDFAGIDGWNMYHGSTVPGFPQHPHRGFETVTYIRRGWCDHSDSLGAQARFGQGDVQWITAGSGLVHSEMFPLIDETEPNPLHLFQLWLNLPAANKMVAPYFSMLWGEDIPTVEVGDGVQVTLIAGSLDGEDQYQAPEPPPDSWASQSEGLEIFHVELSAGSSWQMPAASEGANRVLYFFAGSSLDIDGQAIGVGHAAVLSASSSPQVTALGQPAEYLILSGRPIGEPVAQYGPFVMNDQAEIAQAFADYRNTGFGGWPWPSDDPVHGHEPQRFVARGGVGETQVYP